VEGSPVSCEESGLHASHFESIPGTGSVQPGIFVTDTHLLIGAEFGLEEWQLIPASGHL
jgi:hypothetical protein